jgi:oxygen-independent coproporphyrinogen III oxidase
MDLTTRAGLYLHIPFCRSKCPYCSFYSFLPGARDTHRYLEAVRMHMRQWAGLPEVRDLAFASIFFGGGTPSTLPVDGLALLLADCRALFSFAEEEPEISIEINPGTIDGKGLQELRRGRVQPHLHRGPVVQ